jgi:hypothetical protein
MPFNPAKLTNGQPLKCDANRPEVYRFDSGKIRWYPNPGVASSWDPNYGNFVVTDCTHLTRGPDMPYNPAQVHDGQAVKCDRSRPEVYRYTGGKLRWYPNPTIADSWDRNWRQFQVIDCSNIPHGPDMAMKPRLR